MNEQRPAPNRNGTFALAGVLIGFFLPVVLCLCLALATTVPFALSFGSMGGAGASGGALPAAAPVPQHASGPLTGPAVAIIDVVGPIVTAGDGSDLFGAGGVAASSVIVRSIEAAAKDPQVRAIVLYVNSPGGSVFASDEIYNALKRSGKPVVAYMSEIAASGGYYVSMAAGRVYAHPDTLTGSIGVISQFTNVEELFGKLGVKVTTITSGSNKDFGSQTRPFTDEDRRLWQSVIDETYDNFAKIVADSRKLPLADVKRLADGRLYTGRQALAAKLVDELGYERDAIRGAADLGGIRGEPRVVRYRRGSPFAALFGESLAGAIADRIAARLGLSQALPTSPLEYR